MAFPASPFLPEYWQKARKLKKYPISVNPETRLFSSPSTGEERVGVIMIRNLKTSCFQPPHPAPLPLGEREFPDEHQLVV